jgi:hypothetical protein
MLVPLEDLGVPVGFHHPTADVTSDEDRPAVASVPWLPTSRASLEGRAAIVTLHSSMPLQGWPIPIRSPRIQSARFAPGQLKSLRGDPDSRNNGLVRKSQRGWVHRLCVRCATMPCQTVRLFALRFFLSWSSRTEFGESPYPSVGM